MKIGKRPAAKIQTLRVKDGWARPEHIARAKARLATATPYITAVTADMPRLPKPTEQPMPALSGADEQTSKLPVRVSPPLLKDEGWG